MALHYWHITPLNASLLIALLAVYLFGSPRVKAWQTLAFVSGWFLLVAAVCSPLRWLASHNVMSAHMAAHVAVLMVGAPLMVLGLPQSVFTRGPLRWVSNFLGRRFWVAWLAGVGTMWLWHFPAFHNALLHTVGLSFCYPASGSTGLLASFVSGAYYPSLLIAGALLAWPLASPVKRLRGPYAVAYLFAACVGCSLLGISIAFSPALLYDLPVTQPDPGGLMHVFGTGRLNDQQWAGLIMWVPGCLLYAFASLALLMQWFREEEKLYVSWTSLPGEPLNAPPENTRP